MTVSIGLGWVQIFSLVVGWLGLGLSGDGLGSVGSHKVDPWTTLSARIVLQYKHRRQRRRGHVPVNIWSAGDEVCHVTTQFL